MSYSMALGALPDTVNDKGIARFADSEAVLKELAVSPFVTEAQGNVVLGHTEAGTGLDPWPYQAVTDGQTVLAVPPDLVAPGNVRFVVCWTGSELAAFASFVPKSTPAYAWVAGPAEVLASAQAAVVAEKGCPQGSMLVGDACVAPATPPAATPTGASAVVDDKGMLRFVMPDEVIGRLSFKAVETDREGETWMGNTQPGGAPDAWPSQELAKGKAILAVIPDLAVMGPVRFAVVTGAPEAVGFAAALQKQGPEYAWVDGPPAMLVDAQADVAASAGCAPGQFFTAGACTGAKPPLPPPEPPPEPPPPAQARTAADILVPAAGVAVAIGVLAWIVKSSKKSR